MKTIRDYIGEKSGRLICIGLAGKDSHGRQLFMWQCTCGNVIIKDAYSVLHGRTKSCGCLRREMATEKKGLVRFNEGVAKYGDFRKKRAKSQKGGMPNRGKKEMETERKGVIRRIGHPIHYGAKRNERGLQSRLYRIWSGIKTRCYNQNNPAYRYYGAKGITMCDDWRNSFVAFRDWSISHGYDDSLTIDRIDNFMGYSPSNCRWETMEHQRLHTRRSQITNKEI